MAGPCSVFGVQFSDFVAGDVGVPGVGHSHGTAHRYAVSEGVETEGPVWMDRVQISDVFVRDVGESGIRAISGFQP